MNRFLPMKYKPLSFVIILALYSFGMSSQALAQFGLAAGLNFDSFEDIQVNNRQTTYDNATGYHFGIFLDLGAGPIGLRPGVYYREFGDIETNVTGVLESFDLSLVEVPIDLRLSLAAIPVIRPYVTAGPVLSFASTTNEDYKDLFSKFYVSANIGVGLEIMVPGVGLRLLPEIRYALGITELMKDSFEVRGVSFTADDTQRLNGVMLRLGVAF